MPIDRKRVRELAEDNHIVVRVESGGRVIGPEPTHGLAADLNRAAARVRTAAAALDAATYQFQWDTAGHVAADPYDEAAADLEAALRECFRLGGHYWTETFHSGRQRSSRSVSARVAVLMAAYSEIVAACPKIIDHIREGAPGLANSLEWLKSLDSLASGRLPT
jgi:hypothetical protein